MKNINTLPVYSVVIREYNQRTVYAGCIPAVARIHLQSIYSILELYVLFYIRTRVHRRSLKFQNFLSKNQTHPFIDSFLKRTKMSTMIIKCKNWAEIITTHNQCDLIKSMVSIPLLFSSSKEISTNFKFLSSSLSLIILNFNTYFHATIGID